MPHTAGDTECEQVVRDVRNFGIYGTANWRSYQEVALRVGHSRAKVRSRERRPGQVRSEALVVPGGRAVAQRIMLQKVAKAADSWSPVMFRFAKEVKGGKITERWYSRSLAGTARDIH